MPLESRHKWGLCGVLLCPLVKACVVLGSSYGGLDSAISAGSGQSERTSQGDRLPLHVESIGPWDVSGAFPKLPFERLQILLDLLDVDGYAPATHHPCVLGKLPLDRPHMPKQILGELPTKLGVSLSVLHQLRILRHR